MKIKRLHYPIRFNRLLMKKCTKERKKQSFLKWSYGLLNQKIKSSNCMTKELSRTFKILKMFNLRQQ